MHLSRRQLALTGGALSRPARCSRQRPEHSPPEVKHDSPSVAEGPEAYACQRFVPNRIPCQCGKEGRGAACPTPFIGAFKIFPIHEVACGLRCVIPAIPPCAGSQ